MTSADQRECFGPLGKSLAFRISESHEAIALP